MYESRRKIPSAFACHSGNGNSFYKTSAWFYKRLDFVYKSKNHFTPPTLAQNRASQFNSVARFQQIKLFQPKISKKFSKKTLTKN